MPARANGPRSATGNGASGETVESADLERLLEALRAARNGEMGVRIKTRRGGMVGELARAFNELAELREATTKELVRASRVIGREGRLAERARVPGAGGSWALTTDAFNTLVEDLVRPTTEVARVIEAVAEGDLSQKTDLQVDGHPLRGEFARVGRTVNRMVDQLSVFAEEVTRVAREVGTEGKLGGQAKVKGVSGVWKDLTDNVNTLADNLTQPGAEHRRGHDRGGERRPQPQDHGRRQGRDPRAQEHDQHDGRPALLVRRRGHAGRARGGHRGQAGRPGAGARRLRHLEGRDRQRQHPRRQPLHAGPQRRRGDDRGGERRPQPQDHRRRAGRDPRAQEHDQRHGRPAARVLRRGHARRPRGRHRGQARRPGPRRGRLRRLGRPHRQRQHARRQPDRPGAQHRRGHDRRRDAATSRARSPSTSAARCSSSRRPSTRWSTSCARSRPRSPASPARSAPRASSAARRASRASPARGRT